MKQIIFFIESPYNARDHKRFGIELLSRNGFDVEVWDFTPLLHPDTRQKMRITDPIDFVGLRRFSVWDDACRSVKELSSDSLVVVLVGYSIGSYRLYRALSLSHAKYAVSVANSAQPVLDSSLQSIIDRLRNFNFQKIPNAIYNRMSHHLWGIRPADILIAGGVSSLDYVQYPVDRSTQIVWAHTLDYDIYLERSSPETIGQACVFLDEYLPFHPDFAQAKLRPPVSANKYYPSLCRFFAQLERELDLEVIIAAHPRSDYRNHDPLWGGRRVIRGSTFELVRSTKFCLIHSSTAISFAILEDKPILFLTTDELKQTKSGRIINRLASLLGKTVLNVDNPESIDWDKEMENRKDLYSIYINNYLKKNDTENSVFWQIFANHIPRLGKAEIK